MKVHLKIKIKSLAAEALIIRQEERRYTKRVLIGHKVNARTGEQEPRYRTVRNHPVRLSLRDHRKGVVRQEARASLIAYGFLNGVPLQAFDRLPWRVAGNKLVNVDTGVDLKKVQAMVVRFGGGPDALKGFDIWTMGDLSAAKAA